jgi:3-hydroxyisobutyrate dehydrogenase-like beta-hydroxyacid dehydrogenase
MNVTVVGIGAMGGGMARALLESDSTTTVVGYDTNGQAVEIFFRETQVANKSPKNVPKSLADAITTQTNIVVISLVNEGQCEQVCFGGDENLFKLLSKGSCVILTSTVTATWAKKADEIFRAAGIKFVDCPVSGGPARARDGDLTLMASGEEDCLSYSRPVLDALARDVHIIQGGAGGGSTVKCVHQLLAGVHICVAAEAMGTCALRCVKASLPWTAQVTMN